MTVYYLSHSGVPGQQAGDRNGPPYPLPAAIRAKLAARAAEMKERREKKKELKSKKKALKQELKRTKRYRRMKIDDMNNEELQEFTKRLRIEADYYRAIADLKTQTAGKSIVSKFLSKSADAAINTGSRAFVDSIFKQFGIDTGNNGGNSNNSKKMKAKKK